MRTQSGNSAYSDMEKEGEEEETPLLTDVRFFPMCVLVQFSAHGKRTSLPTTVVVVDQTRERYNIRILC